MKKIITIISFLFVFVIKANAWYNYPYVCDNANCFNTNFQEINKNSSWYFMSNWKINSIDNLNSYINSKLQEYSNYYWSTKITIGWYYQNWWEVEDKKVTFSQLMSLWSFNIAEEKWIVFKTIVINETYSNWKDYLFSNFTDIINKFHSQFPAWERKNQLYNILEQIVYYDSDKKKFAIKNICNDSKCYDSNYLLVNYDSTNSYKILYWNIKPNSSFVSENFKVSEDFYISDNLIKWWDSINFNFKFDDYLDASISQTNYKYTIYYKYQGDTILNKFLTETISVSKDFKVTSPNIQDDIINNIIDLDIIDRDSKEIRIWVKEWLNLTKAWKVQFYFSVSNLTTWEKFDNQLINYSPLEVLPNDSIEATSALITSTFNKALNNFWFNTWDTFSVNLSFKDKFWNEQYDYIDWYEVSIADWSSEYIELSKAWSNTYSKVLTWVKTSQSSPYDIDFKFRITQSWYHILNWFIVKAKVKKDSATYVVPIKYYVSEAIVPTNLYDWNQKLNIYIKPPTVNDFALSCSKWPITIKTKCTSDNFSWCNATWNKSITFTNESQNWSQWVLSIIDYAYNVKSYQYSMNHIDQTAPEITFKLWNEVLNWSNYNFKAKEGFYVDISEKTPSTCVSIAETSYVLKVNWKEILNKKTSELSTSIDLSQYLTVSWTKIIYVKTTDKFWNSRDKTVTFNIFPTDDNLSTKNEWILTVSSQNDKYADNSDYYEYTLQLKDKFWNAIYDKEISLFDQNCSWSNQCKTIKTNMITSSWDDAIVEDLSNNKTNSEWKVFIKVKSLTPWEFSQRFKIIMNEWDDSYKDLSSKSEFFKSIVDGNSFKKPFLWKLLASSDWVNFNELPVIWTNMHYKLEISSIGTLSSTSINISNFLPYVKVVDSVNTVLQNKSEVSWLNSKQPLFSARINTSVSATSLSSNPWIKISDDNEKSPVQISYNLWWKEVTYYLSDNELPTSRDVIKIESKSSWFLWIKIIWQKQWWWKLEITWQKSNVSDIATSSVREEIRKNAFNFIKNMKSWQTLNWVKYIKWDINISWDQSYETLVVENWNVIISWDLNTSGKKLWIIVLKDWYNIEKDFKNKWNIYINQNVKKVNATLYADGWLISSNSSWIAYSEDNTSRTASLKAQLYIKWSLFTRNTIWWSIFTWWNYILPWWNKTQDFDNAMVYDLNYLRTWNNWCDKNWNNSCSDIWEYTESLIIEYNPTIQTNPPKLFSNL